jgi:hypothetical protein
MVFILRLIIGFYKSSNTKHICKSVQLRDKVTDKVGAGFAYFSVATQDPEVKTGFIFQNIEAARCNSKAGFRKSEFDTRYQLEERFVHNASKVTLEDGTTF